MLRLLRALPWAAVVEKASIDEAYILIKQAKAGAAAATAAELFGEDGAPGWGAEDDGGGEGPESVAQAALQRAHEVKAAGAACSGLMPFSWTCACTQQRLHERTELMRWRPPGARATSSATAQRRVQTARSATWRAKAPLLLHPPLPAQTSFHPPVCSAARAGPDCFGRGGPQPAHGQAGLCRRQA